ncbi:MAG: tRNA (adenosine(37)-N6)-threonylcarbamoyltransferase complex ATPase subunit type 1 TsaE [Candidatus Pacebacteria bacterium]|nr:tRNA (adenosine(37)-N6)-threonylcarbamoyltransferase complex ATPase subunit type 1 TsaE [Candidatus Paceibacterota bacterium]MBP9701073.1 tRNA (adenosine(37)-N6)-threonylcarbamoyltransferase complex ATPase subunit type 1 TsaE [Candidatus Paceibacterota bacterium]
MDFHYTEHEVVATAKHVLEQIVPNAHGATVVGLSGDLGAGKTTLVKALAQLLGISEIVVSPTFVIAKFYDIPGEGRWKALIHIDAYRIEHTDELVPLGWEKLIADPATLIVVEWPERIATMLPPTAHRIHIAHTDTGRHIKAV